MRRNVLERNPEELQVDVRQDAEMLAGVRIVIGALVIDMSLKHLLAEVGGR